MGGEYLGPPTSITGPDPGTARVTPIPVVSIPILKLRCRCRSVVASRAVFPDFGSAVRKATGKVFVPRTHCNETAKRNQFDMSGLGVQTNTKGEMSPCQAKAGAWTFQCFHRFSNSSGLCCTNE